MWPKSLPYTRQFIALVTTNALFFAEILTFRGNLCQILTFRAYLGTQKFIFSQIRFHAAAFVVTTAEVLHMTKKKRSRLQRFHGLNPDVP